MRSSKDDICGVVKTLGRTEFICVRPPHVKLQIVRPGDRSSKFTNLRSAHRFEKRYPYISKDG